MVVTSAFNCSFTYTRQTYTTRGAGFADMLYGRSSGGAPESGESPLSAAAKDTDILEQLYRHLTGQALGVKSGVNTAKTGTFEQTFISPAILARSGKVDTTRPFNAESLGDRQLTNEQIAELKSKYDFDNMSYQDQYDFFCDLTDMGVLSVEDVESISLSTMAKPGILTVSSETYTFTRITLEDSSNNLLEYLMATLCRERTDYEYMQNLCADKDSDDYQNHPGAVSYFQENQTSIEALISRHEKVCGVLSNFYV